MAEKDGVNPISTGSFHALTKEMNVAVFKPRKDLCDRCFEFMQLSSYNRSKKLPPPIKTPEFEMHWHLKNQARESKDFDNKNIKKDEIIITVDCQATLLTPVLEASKCYYKMKLNIHNQTIFNNVTHEADNYLWDETQGGLDSSIFATILCKHLKKCVDNKPNIKKIIIYSDGCNYQNRSIVISNALLLFSVTHDVIIEHKYLKKGHTQMEVDNVHSLIERTIRNQVINEPDDYVNFIRAAKITAPFYNVHYLNFGYFNDYTTVDFYSDLRPGKKAGDPTVFDIRCLQYLPTPQINYKLRYDEDYQPLPQRLNDTPCKKVTPTYTERLSISDKKFKHLMELKPLTAPSAWSFYDDLPHK
jgi:hypothetical protein